MFHLAGLVVHSRTVGVQQMQNTNVEGTLNVVRAAARCKVKRVVYASTSGVVGCSDSSQAYANDQSEYCTEKVARWPYYASKIEAEQKGRVQIIASHRALLFSGCFHRTPPAPSFPPPPSSFPLPPSPFLLSPLPF